MRTSRRALLSQTVIARCPTLSRARGLDTLELLTRPPSTSPRCATALEHLPDELLARMGVDGEQLAALRSASSARAASSSRLSLAALDLRGDAGQQIRRHAELTQLLSHPRQDARLEGELAGTRRADLEMLLDQVHLGMGQPPVEEVVESAEGLFAGGPIQGMAHSAAPVVMSDDAALFRDLPQRLLQHLPSAMQPRPHGADGTAQRLGDLLVAQSLP